MLACLLLALPAAQTVQHTYYGDSAGDEFGSAVDVLGDLDGDGRDEFVVGAHWDSNNGFHAGSVTVFDGRTGQALAVFYGDTTQDWLGTSVAGAGDVDADGVPDIIAGAPQPSPSISKLGYARVYSGRTGATLYTWYGGAVEDYAGYAVDGVGDLDRDGHAEIAVSAKNDDTLAGVDSGSVTVYSGSTGTVLFFFSGDSGGDYLGTSLAGCGDVNADGVPDIAAGASPIFGTGYVRVFSGRDGSSLQYYSYGGMFDQFGVSCDGAGDVDGDGYGDVIVGANLDGGFPEPGSARVLSGASGGLIHEYWGDLDADSFGWSVRNAGDVDGDGVPDALVGAWQSLIGFGNGYARLFSGADGAVLLTLTGEGLDDDFGYAVAPAGDTDGEGLLDLLVGALSDDDNGASCGSARLLTGFLLLREVAPGVAGAANVLEAAHATPGARVYFAYGSSAGRTPIPGCGSLSVGILHAQLAGTAYADPQGHAALARNVPAAASGRLFFYQAVQPSLCLASAVLSITFS